MICLSLVQEVAILPNSGRPQQRELKQKSHRYQLSKALVAVNFDVHRGVEIHMPHDRLAWLDCNRPPEAFVAKSVYSRSSLILPAVPNYELEAKTVMYYFDCIVSYAQHDVSEDDRSQNLSSGSKPETWQACTKT